jgi:hypothetical protein
MKPTGALIARLILVAAAIAVAGMAAARAPERTNFCVGQTVSGGSPVAREHRNVTIMLDRRRPVMVAASIGEAVDAPIAVRMARRKGQRTGQSCWSFMASATITGNETFGVREKSLSIIAVFAADADKDGRDEIVIVHSAYIDGTGQAERYAAAIFKVTPSGMQRQLAFEPHFFGVSSESQFRQRTRQR